MKKNKLVLGLVSCIVILMASHQAVVNSQTLKCPEITGTWILDDNSTLKITNKKGCKIEGYFKGQQSVLRFNGHWDNNEKAYKYDGTASKKGKKCELIVDGTLTLQNSKLENHSSFNYTNQCIPPTELKRKMVFTRR